MYYKMFSGNPNGWQCWCHGDWGQLWPLCRSVRQHNFRQPKKDKTYNMCVIRSLLQTDSTPKDPTWTSGVSRTAAASILSKTTHSSASLNFSSMQPRRLIHIQTNMKIRTRTYNATLISGDNIDLCVLSRYGTQFLTNPALLQTPQD